MRRITPFVSLALVLALGCYTDDTGVPTDSRPLGPTVTVRLTDDPFPFDSVASVNIYIDSIEASPAADTLSGGTYVTIASPHRAFNLLALQQGVADSLGAGALKVGQYKSFRLTMDVDSSSILWSGGIPMSVQWGSTGRIQLNVVIEPVFSVGDSGADLVLDFDVARSFPFNQLGHREFDFFPTLRAVNNAEAGSIEGTVTDTLSPGSPQPLANANVEVIPLSTGATLATGRTDASGHYKVAFLPADTYQVRVVQPLIPALDTTVVSNVQVTKLQATTVPVVMTTH